VLNIKVETVDDSVLSRASIKGTRASPWLLEGSKGTPQEVGELYTVLGAADLVVAAQDRVVDTTDAEQNLDALLLAEVDVPLHVKALAQESRRNAILILVGAGAAVSGKVGAWESRGIVLRRLVDERQRDKVDTGRAVLSERLEANLALYIGVSSQLHMAYISKL
jgi:hypothetical protein